MNPDMPGNMSFAGVLQNIVKDGNDGPYFSETETLPQPPFATVTPEGRRSRSLTWQRLLRGRTGVPNRFRGKGYLDNSWDHHD